MLTNPQIPAALMAFTNEILNGKLHFLCSNRLNMRIWKQRLRLWSHLLKKFLMENFIFFTVIYSRILHISLKTVVRQNPMFFGF